MSWAGYAADRNCIPFEFVPGRNQVVNRGADHDNRLAAWRSISGGEWKGPRQLGTRKTSEHWAEALHIADV